MRLSAIAQLDTNPLAPYIGVLSESIPVPYPLALTPDGPLTHAPAISFGDRGWHVPFAQLKVFRPAVLLTYCAPRPFRRCRTEPRGASASRASRRAARVLDALRRLVGIKCCAGCERSVLRGPISKIWRKKSFSWCGVGCPTSTDAAWGRGWRSLGTRSGDIGACNG